MATITVQVWNAVGNTRCEVSMPDDKPASQILDVLVAKMDLPQIGPDDLPLVYEFVLLRSRKLVFGDKCLQEVGAKDGDVLRLIPQIPRRTPTGTWCSDSLRGVS